jgi:DNA-directed RNA polymerase specialized sigma24 family protein
LEELDQKLTRGLIGFLYGVMGIPEADAEELACETLFTVSSHIHTFQHGGRAKLTTWIFEIAKNKAIDFHRKQESQPEEVALADGFPHCAPAGACAGRNAPYLSWLREQFAKMEDSDRELLLWRAADIPYEQIAGWMGISEGTARTRYSRLRAKLVAAGKTVEM